jgi:hypothetical protein
VKAASARVGNALGVFDKIFVFVPVADGQQAFQLYPRFSGLGFTIPSYP